MRFTTEAVVALQSRGRKTNERFGGEVGRMKILNPSQLRSPAKFSHRAAQRISLRELSPVLSLRSCARSRFRPGETPQYRTGKRGHSTFLRGCTITAGLDLRSGNSQCSLLLVPFLRSLYVDHTGIAAHPADQALRVLTRRRAVVPEDALKALNVGGREKMGMHIDLHS
jgi:hypothetical protein